MKINFSAFQVNIPEAKQVPPLDLSSFYGPKPQVYQVPTVPIPLIPKKTFGSLDLSSGAPTIIRAPQATDMPLRPDIAGYKAGEPSVKVPFSNKVLQPIFQTHDQNNQLNDFLNSSIKYIAEFPEELANTVQEFFQPKKAVSTPLNVPRVQTPLSVASDVYEKAKSGGSSELESTFLGTAAGTFKFVADFAPLYPFAKLGAQRAILQLPENLLVKISTSEIPASEIRGALTGDVNATPRAIKFVQKLSNEDRKSLFGVVREAEKTSGIVKTIEAGEPTALGEFAGVKSTKLNTNAFERHAPEQQLPGTAIVGEPQPKLGLSIQPVKKVGGEQPIGSGVPFEKVSPEILSKAKEKTIITKEDAVTISRELEGQGFGVEGDKKVFRSNNGRLSVILGESYRDAGVGTPDRIIFTPDKTGNGGVISKIILPISDEQFLKAPERAALPGGENLSQMAQKPSGGAFVEEPAKGAPGGENGAKKGVPDKLPELPGLEKPTGGIPGKRGLKKVGLAPEPSDKIVTTEEGLLHKRIRDEARGAKIGYKAGTQETRISITHQLQNTFDMKIGEVKRAGELGALKTRIITRDFDRVKKEIVDYAKETLPTSDRGQLLNMVANAKTQKDLTRAFVRINKKSDEIIIASGISELKKSVEKLTESGSIAIDYKNKIKELVSEYELKGHTAGTIEKLKSTQDYLNKARAAGENVDLPQRLLDRLKILDRIPKDKITISQIRGLQQEVELLGQLGKTKLKSRQALYDAEKEARAKQLLDIATPIESSEGARTPVGERPEARKRWIEKYISARNFIQKTRIGLTPIDGLAEITGMTPMKDALDVGYGNYLASNDARFEKLGEIVTRNQLTEVDIKKVGTYAIAKQEGGMQRLVDNNGIPEKEITDIVLNPGEQELYDFVIKENEAVYPEIKKWAADEYNVDVGKVDNYVSFQSSFDEMNDLAVYDRFGRRPEEEFVKMRTKNVEKGFIESRNKMSKNALETDIVKVFMRHMDDAMYGLNMGRDTKMYFEIVNSPEMRQKLGDVGSLAWLQWLDLMARKGGIDGATRIAALDILRKNISAGVLAFRLSSALVQFTSFADTAATIGTEWATRGATSIATSKEWRAFIMDNFPEIRKAVGDDVAFREFDDIFFEKAAKVGLKPLQVLDGLMRSTAASGAYQKLAAEKGIVIDLANPDKELIQGATKYMRQSQGSSFFKDQPLAISTGYGLAENRSVNKALLTFQSFMLHRWDNIQRQVWRLGIKEGNYKKASMSFLWIVLIAAAAEEGIRRGTRKIIDLSTGSETNAGSFVGNAELNMVQSVPILGQLVSSMTYSSNPVPIINTFDDLIAGLSSATGGSTLQTKLKGGIRAAGALGSFSGIPGSSQGSQILGKAIPSATKKGAGSSKLPGLPGISVPSSMKLPGASKTKLPALPGL